MFDFRPIPDIANDTFDEIDSVLAWRTSGKDEEGGGRTVKAALIDTVWVQVLTCGIITFGQSAGLSSVLQEVAELLFYLLHPGTKETVIHGNVVGVRREAHGSQAISHPSREERSDSVSGENRIFCQNVVPLIGLVEDFSPFSPIVL